MTAIRRWKASAERLEVSGERTLGRDIVRRCNIIQDGKRLGRRARDFVKRWSSLRLVLVHDAGWRFIISFLERLSQGIYEIERGRETDRGYSCIATSTIDN